MGKRVKNEEFDFSDIVDSDEQFDFNDVTDEENEFDFSDVVEEAPKGTVKTGWGNSINPTEHPLIKFGTGLVKSAASFIKDQLPKTHALVDQEANLDYARRFQTMLDEELAKPNPSQKNVEWLRGAIAQWRDQAVDAEQEIATQNEDTSNTLEGVNQDLFESKSVGDVSSFLGSMVGQGLPQLVLAGVTRGTSSYVQESAAIWDQQMDQLSQKYNLSREEVIEKGLDEPAASKAYAILAAGLDAASAGSVLSRFRKAAGSGKSVIKDLGLEGSTEAAQGNIERFAASQGAGTESNLLSTENAKSSVNEFVGGVAGAGPLSILSTHKKAAVKAAEQAIEETSSGTPEIDAIIDEAGTLTPEESQALAEIKVAEQEEATLDIVNKTDDSVNNNLQSAENTATIAAEAEIDTPEFKQVSKEVEDLRSQIANLPVTASQEEGFKLFVKFTEAREKLQNLIKVGPPRDADLQYSLFDAVDQKIKVTDAEGNTGTLKLDQGGKLTLENSSKIIELGNLDTEIDPATPIRDFGLKLSKTAEPRQEKSVKMTPNEAIKQQVQTFYKGVQEGVYRGKDASNELVNKVQEAIKESPLSAKQVSTILTKVRKTNLFTPGSISRLNTFIDKVSSDAEYAEQVSQTEEVNSDVKGLLKKSTPKERSVLQVFSALESDDLQSLPKHIALGNLIKKSNRPVNSQDFVPLNLESVNRYVTDATTQIYESEFGRKPVNMTPEQMFNEVQKQRYRQRSEERVNKIADDLGLNFDERQLLLQSDTEVEDKIADENKKEKLKDQLVNIARTVGSRLKTVPTEDYKDILDRVKSVKPDELSITDLKKYIEVVERITENNDFGDSSDIAAIGAAQKGIEILLPKIKKHIIGLTGIEADYTASLSQAFKSIFGLSTEAATFQENSGIKGISDAHAYSLEDEEAIVNKFNSMHDEFKNKKNNGFSTESIFRRGLYKTLIKHDAAVDGDEYLRTKGKPAIETTIRSYRSIGDEESAKVVEALYEPFKNVQTIKEASEVMERIDPLSKQVFDEVVKWYDRYKPEVKKYNEVYYGDFSQDIVNYAGETHVRPVGIKLTEIDDMMYKPGTLKPKRLDSSRRFSGSVPEGSIVDLNFDVNVVRHIKKLSFELKAHPYVAQVEAFAKQKEKVLEMFGYQKGIPETLKKAQNIYDKIFDRNDGLYKSFLDDSYGIGRMSKSDQNIAKTLSAVHKLVYTATLSGITQAPKQYTVLASTAINLGTDAGVVFSSIVEIAQNKSDFKELIKGESVSSRGREASVVNLGNWLDASEFLKTESTIKKLFSSQFPDQIDRVFNSMWGGLKLHGCPTTSNISSQ